MLPSPPFPPTARRVLWSTKCRIWKKSECEQIVYIKWIVEITSGRLDFALVDLTTVVDLCEHILRNTQLIISAFLTANTMVDND